MFPKELFSEQLISNILQKIMKLIQKYFTEYVLLLFLIVMLLLGGWIMGTDVNAKEVNYVYFPVVTESQPNCIAPLQPRYNYELEQVAHIVSGFVDYDNMVVTPQGAVFFSLDNETEPIYQTWLSCSTVVYEELDCVEFIDLGIDQVCENWHEVSTTTFEDWLEFRVYVTTYYEMGLEYEIGILHEELTYSLRDNENQTLATGQLYNSNQP